MKRALILGILCLGLIGGSIVQAERPLSVVSTIDLSRYAGRWYEIARLPNKFQKDCVGDVSADYTLRSDGKIEVLNKCREQDGEIKEAKGLARRADDDKPNSILEVRFAPSLLSFLPQVWGDYYVIALANDYSHALVGSPDRKYLWVLARNRRLDEATYQNLLEKARNEGFDVSKMQRTTQSQ